MDYLNSKQESLANSLMIRWLLKSIMERMERYATEFGRSEDYFFEKAAEGDVRIRPLFEILDQKMWNWNDFSRKHLNHWLGFFFVYHKI